MFKNILLAFDGSDHAFRAAKTAGELARIMQADLRLVVAYDAIPSFLGEPNLHQVMAARISAAEALLEKAVHAVGEISGEVKTEVMEGPPAEAILKVAETRKNDLIVMGTRGLGRLQGLLLGSQSQKVVAHASCPVLLVR